MRLEATRPQLKSQQISYPVKITTGVLRITLRMMGNLSVLKRCLTTLLAQIRVHGGQSISIAKVNTLAG